MAAGALLRGPVTVLLHERQYIQLTHARVSVRVPPLRAIHPMKRTPISSLLILLWGVVLANVAAAAEMETIKKVLAVRYPEVTVVDVRPSEITGLYEIYTGDAIVYANDNADFLIAGPMVDTRNRQNISADHLDQRNAIDFSTLPFDKAIKTVKGNGSRKVAVFADPDCPYCKHLEKELASVNNVTIYTFLYPLSELHPDAQARARAIWCSKDRSKAWTEWMASGRDVSAPGDQCKADPIADLRALGIKLRINSTPTLVFSNGQRTSGALPAAQLESRLEGKKPDSRVPGS
jgi:thiol:disulfide interchange protein DsbC